MDVGQGVRDPDTVFASRYASKTLENDEFTDLRILGGAARMGGRVRHGSKDQLTAGFLAPKANLRTAPATKYAAGALSNGDRVIVSTPPSATPPASA